MSMRAAAAEPSLLDPARLARFHGLVLRVPGGAGEQGGQQRVPGRADAAGLEVEAYRSYTPGDDLRHLDWNALGRLDALLGGRPHVTPDDVDAVAHASLAHRLVLRFAAEADGADPHRIVDAALAAARGSRG